MSAEKRPPSKTILIVGGSGYLGQFLVEDLASTPTYKVGYTHHSTSAPEFGHHVDSFWVDLKTGEGLQDCFEVLGPVDVVINCAAISAPGECEKYPDVAQAINVPTRLLDALDVHQSAYSKEPLLIQISTDQVFDGSGSGYTESDGANPINVYGRTKREAEVLVADRWPNHIILRASIIYGPQSPMPVGRMLFLQFIDRALKEGKPTTFFEDEFRCPIYVKDILEVLRKLILLPPRLQGSLYHMGGPQRLSRLDMAMRVAEKWGYDKSAIVAVPSSSVNRPTPSPPDISMSSELLAKDLGMRFTTFGDALADMKVSPIETAASIDAL